MFLKYMIHDFEGQIHFQSHTLKNVLTGDVLRTQEVFAIVG